MAQETTTNPELNVRKENKAKLRYQRDKDRELVTGMFHFHEVPGGSMSFVYRGYREDQVERYDMIDNQIYKIPLGVAKHLNKNGWYPVHSYAVDDHGKPIMKIGQKVRRFSFRSLEFIDSADLTPEGSANIITVQRV